MTTAAYLIVSFALGVGLGGLILAAVVVGYVLRTRCVDLRTDVIKEWRAK
jgi:hypothetical protein